MRFVAVVLLAALLAGGCATLSGPPPLTRDDLVRMAKTGDSPQAIIDRLRDTGTVLALSASDIVRLHQSGVPHEVLDYLQQVQIAEVRRRDALLYSYPPYASFFGCPWRFRHYPHPWVMTPWGPC
jgi:hypothetical protein